jgi:hypothetical protein
MFNKTFKLKLLSQLNVSSEKNIQNQTTLKEPVSNIQDTELNPNQMSNEIKEKSGLKKNKSTHAGNE